MVATIFVLRITKYFLFKFILPCHEFHFKPFWAGSAHQSAPIIGKKAINVKQGFMIIRLTILYRTSVIARAPLLGALRHNPSAILRLLRRLKARAAARNDGK
jgi:hypothetical protein